MDGAGDAADENFAGMCIKGWVMIYMDRVMHCDGRCGWTEWTVEL